MNKFTACMIPARKGSKRCPGKNTRPFLGPSLLERAIKLAVASNLFHRVIVSSDDEVALRIADQGGVIPCWRPAYLATDDADTEAVITHIATQFPEYHDLCCLYTQAGAFITPQILEFSYFVNYDFGKPLVSYSGDKDAGQFYWIPVLRFLTQWATGIELLQMDHDRYDLNPERVQDINTEEDWTVAEEKYRRLNP